MVAGSDPCNSNTGHSWRKADFNYWLRRDVKTTTLGKRTKHVVSSSNLKCYYPRGKGVLPGPSSRLAGMFIR